MSPCLGVSRAIYFLGGWLQLAPSNSLVLCSRDVPWIIRNDAVDQLHTFQNFSPGSFVFSASKARAQKVPVYWLSLLIASWVTRLSWLLARRVKAKKFKPCFSTFIHTHTDNRRHANYSSVARLAENKREYEEQIVILPHSCRWTKYTLQMPPVYILTREN